MKDKRNDTYGNFVKSLEGMNDADKALKTRDYALSGKPMGIKHDDEEKQNQQNTDEVDEESTSSGAGGFSPMNWVSKSKRGSERGIRGGATSGFTPVNEDDENKEPETPYDPNKDVAKMSDKEHKRFIKKLVNTTHSPTKDSRSGTKLKGWFGEPEVDEGYEEESTMYESAPPLPKHIIHKVEKEYGKDNPKAYATMWKIYKQMKEEYMNENVDDQQEDDMLSQKLRDTDDTQGNADALNAAQQYLARIQAGDQGDAQSVAAAKAYVAKYGQQKEDITGGGQVQVRSYRTEKDLPQIPRWYQNGDNDETEPRGDQAQQEENVGGHTTEGPSARTQNDWPASTANTEEPNVSEGFDAEEKEKMMKNAGVKQQKGYWRKNGRKDSRNAYGQTRDKLGQDGRQMEKIDEQQFDPEQKKQMAKLAGVYPKRDDGALDVGHYGQRISLGRIIT